MTNAAQMSAACIRVRSDVFICMHDGSFILGKGFDRMNRLITEQYRLVLADVDGTLCLKGGRLYPQTRRALEQIHKLGIPVGLATGRAINQRVFTLADFWHLSFSFDVLIGMNGGQLWTKESPAVENYHLLSEETLKEILERMRPLNLNAVIYEEEHMVALRMDIFQEESMKRNNTQVIITGGDERPIYAHPNNNVLFRYDLEREEEVLAFAAKLACEKYKPIRTAPGCLEFFDPKVNKGVGVVEYAKKAGISTNAVMAFGDNDNDAEMLEAAGWGVCLKNGSERSKQAADAVTEYNCEEDGVGRYLYDHGFLEQEDTHEQSK